MRKVRLLGLWGGAWAKNEKRGNAFESLLLVQSAICQLKSSCFFHPCCTEPTRLFEVTIINANLGTSVRKSFINFSYTTLNKTPSKWTLNEDILTLRRKFFFRYKLHDFFELDSHRTHRGNDLTPEYLWPHIWFQFLSIKWNIIFIIKK